MYGHRELAAFLIDKGASPNVEYKNQAYVIGPRLYITDQSISDAVHAVHVDQV